MLEGHFINGLSPEIKTELRVLSPRSLEQMMDLAQRIEERNLVLWGNLARLTLNRGQSASLSILNYQHGGPQPHAQPASKPIAVNSPYLFRPQNSGRVSNQPWKRLSEVEWKSKRDKDLCFRCDEKYMIGHKCKNKKLQVMMIYDEEVEEEEQWVREEEDNQCLSRKREAVGEPVQGGEVIELSMNSVAGLTAPQTMKIKEEIEQQPIVVLIDGGATHNFIYVELVQLLGLIRGRKQQGML